MILDSNILDLFFEIGISFCQQCFTTNCSLLCITSVEIMNMFLTVLVLCEPGRFKKTYSLSFNNAPLICTVITNLRIVSEYYYLFIKTYSVNDDIYKKSRDFGHYFCLFQNILHSSTFYAVSH